MYLRRIVWTLLFLGLTGCYTDQAVVVKEPVRKITCLDTGYEISNLCEDEKEYLDWAHQYRPDLRFSDLTNEIFAGIVSETKDVDKAAALFYERAITDPLNRSFLKRINQIEEQTSLAKNSPQSVVNMVNITLAVAPGMFYNDNSGQVDATGQSLRSIAQQIGMKQAVILTEQTGTVEGNGAIICDYIKTSAADEKAAIILASASKGSSDVKMAIEQCGQEPYFKIVRGWINFGGILQGSRVVDYILDHSSAYWKARYYFWKQGYNWQGFLSIRRGEDAPLNQPLSVPSGVTVVNIVGVPLFRHLTPRARPFYLAMVPQGPSDGMVLLSEAYVPGTIVYASFRNDHYFQWPVPEDRIRAFLIYMAEQARR